jgi:cytochrome c
VARQQRGARASRRFFVEAPAIAHAQGEHVGSRQGRRGINDDSYARGKTVYESACAACHGADLKGVAGLPDMPNGAQLRLIGGRGTLATKNPVLTVERFYVRPAMPLSAPGSLASDDVYAVCAYILAEGQIIEKSTVLDARTLPRVAMSNRDGFIPDPRRELFK